MGNNMNDPVLKEDLRRLVARYGQTVMVNTLFEVCKENDLQATKEGCEPGGARVPGPHERDTTACGCDVNGPERCFWCGDTGWVTHQVKSVKDGLGILLDRLYTHFSNDEDYDAVIASSVYGVQVAGGWESPGERSHT